MSGNMLKGVYLFDIKVGWVGKGDRATYKNFRVLGHSPEEASDYAVAQVSQADASVISIGQDLQDDIHDATSKLESFRVYDKENTLENGDTFVGLGNLPLVRVYLFKTEYIEYDATRYFHVLATSEEDARAYAKKVLGAFSIKSVRMVGTMVYDATEKVVRPSDAAEAQVALNALIESLDEDPTITVTYPQQDGEVGTCEYEASYFYIDPTGALFIYEEDDDEVLPIAAHAPGRWLGVHREP